MDSKDSIPGPIIRWLESEIEPVYRYHLARSENYLEAQALAALTFQTALTWIHTRPMEEDRLRSWILTIARFEQSFGRWGASARKLQPAADPTRQPGENVTSPLMASTSFKDLPPEQAEVLLREQISRLSTLWKRLPRRQADALALHYFGGLTLAEVGVVLGKGEREATVWVSREASFERELFEIAANLHPSQELVASITSRVQEAAARPARQAALPARLARWLKADIWQFAFRAQSIFVAGSRAVQVGLLVGVLAAGFYIIQRQSIVPTQAQPTPSQTAAPTISV